MKYDEDKSKSNKEKHGIDFVEAQNLWQNEEGLIVPAKIVGEEVRYALISIFIRDDVYRIISVRRCRKNEEKSYEDNNS